MHFWNLLIVTGYDIQIAFDVSEMLGRSMHAPFFQAFEIAWLNVPSETFRLTDYS